MNEKKTPRIRFKGFTDDWEQRKLSEVTTEFKSGEGIKADEIEENGTYPVYGGNGLRGYTERYNHDGEYALIGRQGALCGNMNYSVGKAYFTEHAVAVKANESNDTRFLYYLLDRMDLGRYSDQSAQPGLAVNKLVVLHTYVPRKQEQEAIGVYFKSLDHLITLHQRKYEKLQIIKKSMLENCFPKNGEKVPKIRFSGFTGDWEQRKLADVAEIIGGGTPSTSNPDYWDGDIDWYAPAEIGEQIFAYGSVRKITKEGLIHSSAKILPAHKTVLFTSRAGIGNMAILKRPAATNQGFQSLVCHDDIDPYFMFSMGDSIKAKAERVAAGSTFAEISGKKLGELEFMFPDTDEQKAIGAYFKNLDYLITLHQKQWFILKKLQFSPGSNSPVAA